MVTYLQDVAPDSSRYMHTRVNQGWLEIFIAIWMLMVGRHGVIDCE